MCGVLGPTAGESWLAYVGVPDDYPDINSLAREIDDAMWEAAQSLLEERKRADPLLRVLADERCTLWTWTTVPAGILPFGAEIHAAYGTAVHIGRLRQPTDQDLKWYPDRLGVDWIGQTGEASGWGRPEVRSDTEVDIRVPMPFDLSALLAVVDQETGAVTAQPSQRVRRVRKAASVRRRSSAQPQQ